MSVRFVPKVSDLLDDRVIVGCYETVRGLNSEAVDVQLRRCLECWNSALCYQLFPVLWVDCLKRFSVLAFP